jgi:Glycosyltransferase family 87
VTSTWVERRLRALRGSATIAFLGLGPLILGAVLISLMYDQGLVAFDVHQSIRPAAELLVNGESPYRTDEAVIAAGGAHPYPPFVTLAYTPLTLVSVGVGDALLTALLILLIPAILLVAGVRDWRCYGAALLWAPVMVAVQTANLSIPLAFAAAVAWRYRDSRWTALPSAVAVGAKTFLWPLVVWLAATGRVRRAIWTIVVLAALVLGSFALIGISTVSDFLDVVRLVGEREAPEALTLYAVGLALGLPVVVAKALWALVGLVALAACLILGRRGDDAASFTMAIGAGLLLAPTLSLHYTVLLLVPLAITRPAFGPAWLLPLLLWAVAGDRGERPEWQAGLTVAVVIAVLVACLSGPRARIGEVVAGQVPERRSTAILSSR